jgi:hypothetical protein
MRPVAVPDALPARSRKSSLAEQVPGLASDLRNAGPTTYFLAHEDDMDDGDADVKENSAFGVHSLEETIAGSSMGSKLCDDESVAEEEGEEESTASNRRSTIRPTDRDHVEEISLPSKHTSRASSNPRPSPQMPIPTSQPLTPLFLASPADGSSLPSSPKSTSTRSFKQLDEESALDETGSQAITSGGEDDLFLEMPSEIQDSAPQLIMPSIKMPSRRPFTQRGKEMGRFKVLIAGGTGKASYE